MTTIDDKSRKNRKQTQSLINLFFHPVLVITNDLTILASNDKLAADTLISNNLPIIMDAIAPLLRGDQELAYCVIEGQEKLCTAMPMEHGRTLVKIAHSTPSALAKRYHNLVTAIDKIPDAAIICSDGRIDLVNEQFQNIFPFSAKRNLSGVPLDTIIRDFSAYLAQNDARLERLIYRFLRMKFNSRQELSLSFTSPDGQFYEYRDNLTFTGGRVGLIINESQIKGLNDKLEDAFKEADALSNAKSNFMAAMSHEVRTPLNGIIGLLDLCEHQDELKGNELLKRVSKSSVTLMNLINDVLDFTKFDANMVTLTPTTINIRTFCEELISAFYGQAKNQNVTLTLFVDPIIPRLVKVDALRLTQVLMNLLSNGLKFNQTKNPTLDLIVLKDDLTQYINFKVIDNGIGIESNKINTIFDRFTQANENIHKTFGGTGLGLSICQKIVQLMDGDIYVQSQLGEGSSFVVQLPLEACSKPEIDEIDIEDLQTYTFETNDPAFSTLLARYAQRCKFQTRLIKGLPTNVCPKHIYIINPLTLSGSDRISNLPVNQTALIADDITTDTHSTIRQIHSVPFKLGELFTLITHPLSVNTHSPSPSQTKSIADHLHILIVEDNSDNMYVIKKQFDALGVKASFALSAEEAIIFFEQQPFNVVISDYQMPVISGVELISILRELELNEKRPPATMMILTADHSKQCEQHCRDVKVDSILMKPLTLKTLGELLCTLNDEKAALSAPIVGDHEETHDVMEFDFIDDSSEIDTAANASRVFDISALTDMVGEISMEEEYEYLYAFQQNLKSDFDNMLEYAAIDDWDNLSKQAHKLKSSARIVGANLLSKKCEEVEYAGSQTSMHHQVILYWQEMKTAIEQLMTHLAEYLNHHDSKK